MAEIPSMDRTRVKVSTLQMQGIDILTSISGVEFDQAWGNRLTIELEGLSVPVIGRSELIANKRAAGRPKDIADAETLDQSDA